MQRGGRKMLGDILLEAGIIDDDQLSRGLELGKQKGVPLGKALISLGFLSADEKMIALSEQLNLPYINLSTYQIDADSIKLVSEETAREMRLVPLFQIQNTLTVAMVDPMDVFSLDELAVKTGLEVEPAICGEDDLQQTLDHYYGASTSVNEVVQILQDEEADGGMADVAGADVTFLDETDEAPVIKLVNLMFTQAIRDGVSDIHIEPEEERLTVRFRQDGVLMKAYEQPKNLTAAVTSRIKIMARLDIAERRVPQDGRIQLRIENRDIDMRVSTMPTAHGENIVLRLLDKTNVIVDVSALGFQEAMQKQFESVLARPYGIMMVTGPTGSGKTTTLYSALHALNNVEKNIHTIEDPIEYRLPMIRQSQVNPKIGLTFAGGLRAFLRQDPDIIMVGEIRDLETARVATQAALTGHLVLTTLHTNDAPGAIGRLVDMGVEPFLVSSALNGVIAQRLVRRICSRCKESYEASDALKRQLKLKAGKKYTFYRGKGCRYCKDKGYKGRVALFEMMELNETLRGLIMDGANAIELRKCAIKNGMKTLYHDGIMKALKGLTSVEEVMRVSMTD